MHSRPRSFALAGFALLLPLATAAPARAAIISMVARLESAQETIDPGTGAQGIATIRIDTDANTLTYHVTYSGLSSPEIASHIHGYVPRGEESFQPPLHFMPLGSPKDGVWNYPEAHEADILAGLTYINIHSNLHQGGEIRGQIEQNLPGAAPGGLLLLGLALLACGALFAPRGNPARGAAR